MLPACRSGKIRTFARPATVEPGAFDSPTRGTKAASACSSPSISKSGWRARTVRVASTTLSTSLCEARLCLQQRAARVGRGDCYLGQLRDAGLYDDAAVRVDERAAFAERGQTFGQ